jgi:vacuolar protein sorting-associated protein 13A/C
VILNISSDAAKSGSSEDTFTMRLITRIVDNLQIEITDVHVRYEDDVTNPGSPFAIGITLEHLAGESTNENWLPSWIENAQIVHKVIECSMS